MKVLLADGSDLILEWLREMLSAFEQVEIVAELKNGNDTLAALRALKPDLAIVDMKMPGLSGLEILIQIRKEDRPVKFIILTFYAFDAYRQSAVKAGVDYYFSKVDDFEQVALVVAELLAKEKNSNRTVLSSKTNLNSMLTNPE
jgi:two-component system response regulator DesR